MVEFQPMGCYKDGAQKTHLQKLILRDSGSKRSVHSGATRGGNKNLQDDFTCRCAKKAAELKYTYFSVHNYG